MLGLNPFKLAVTDTALVPEPIDCDVVELYVNNVLLVPHSHQAVVAKPFGLTLPLSVAEVVVAFVAALVETVGMFERVVKFQLPEYELQPAELPALTRQ